MENLQYEDVKEIHRALEYLNRPAQKEDIGREIYAMTISMAKRRDDDTDYKMLVTIYSQDLAEYPADVVLHVCREIRRTEKFFPTISEIRERCEERVGLRRNLYDQVKLIASNP